MPSGTPPAGAGGVSERNGRQQERAQLHESGTAGSKSARSFMNSPAGDAGGWF